MTEKYKETEYPILIRLYLRFTLYLVYILLLQLHDKNKIKLFLYLTVSLSLALSLSRESHLILLSHARSVSHLDNIIFCHTNRVIQFQTNVYIFIYEMFSWVIFHHLFKRKMY